MQIIALAENTTMTDLTINTNERTHYLLSIDLEESQRRLDAEFFVGEVLALVAEKNAPAVVASLERELIASFDIMPELVKEGINRAYSFPKVKLSQIMPRRSRA
jgi:hypothetical protein